MVEDLHQVEARLAGPPPGRLARLAANEWVRAVAQTASTRVTVVVVGLASTVVLARALGPAGRGAYALAVTIGTLAVVVGNLGFHAVNTYYGAGEPETMPRLAANTGVLAAGAAALSAAVLALAAGLWPDALPVGGGLALLVVGWVLFGMLFTQLQPLLLVTRRVRAYNLADAVAQLGAVALVLVAWALGVLTPTVAYGAAVAALASAVAIVLWRLRDRVLPLRPPSWPLARQALPFALRSYATSVTLLLLLRIDILLVEAYAGNQAVGYYTVAATIGELAQIVPSTIGALLFSRLAAQPHAGERRRVLHKVLAVTAVLMAGLCLAVAVLARPGVRAVYGADFLPSLPAVNWLIPGLFFLGMNSVLLNYFLSERMPTFVVAAEGLAVALNVGLNVVLIPRHGIGGAAAASTVAYGFVFVAMAAYLLRDRRRAPA